MTPSDPPASEVGAVPRTRVPCTADQSVSATDLPWAPMLAQSSQRTLGAFYTPTRAATYMAHWLVSRGSQRVLEPSMGDGAFLVALRTVEASLDVGSLEVWGVEVAGDTHAATIAQGLIDRRKAIRGDFLALDPIPVDGVLGNPPFVRMRNLPYGPAEVAKSAAARVLQAPLDPSASVWMPFVLHASRFLVPGGRLAFVLPYEVTHVRYARSLWRWLSRNFGHLRVVRVRERLFPDLLQEAVLLFADRFGESAQSIDYEVYETTADLEKGSVSVSQVISITDVVEGKRRFVEALLPTELRGLLDMIRGRTLPASDLVSLNIGYVCGDKQFFHPTATTIRAHGIPQRALRPSVTSGRGMNGVGLRTSRIPAGNVDRLFFPASAQQSSGEREYIERGMAEGVHRRYKCRVRDPWYLTPGVKPPDVLLPTFAAQPLLMINDSEHVASNSFLCGYLRQGTVAQLVTGWYTSLTVLQVELEVHSLGGGVLIFIPGEAAKIRLPKIRRTPRGHLNRIDALISSGKRSEAYEVGDAAVLRSMLMLSPDDVDLVKVGIETLMAWREGAAGRSNRVT